MSAVFCGNAEDAPADTIAGFQQRDAQAQLFQQIGGYQARQAGSDDHDLRRWTQSLRCRRRRIRLVCVHGTEWWRLRVCRQLLVTKWMASASATTASRKFNQTPRLVQ